MAEDDKWHQRARAKAKHHGKRGLKFAWGGSKSAGKATVAAAAAGAAAGFGIGTQAAKSAKNAVTRKGGGSGKPKYDGKAVVDAVHSHTLFPLMLIVSLIILVAEYVLHFGLHFGRFELFGVVYVIFGCTMLSMYWSMHQPGTPIGPAWRTAFIRTLASFGIPFTAPYLQGWAYSGVNNFLPEVASSITSSLIFLWFPILLFYGLGWGRYMVVQASQRGGSFGKLLGFMDGIIFLLMAVGLAMLIFAPFMHANQGLTFDNFERPSFFELGRTIYDWFITQYTQTSSAVKGAYNNQFASATQTYYTGQVERQQGLPLGVNVREVEPVQPVFRVKRVDEQVEPGFDKEVLWFGIVSARTFADKVNIDIFCRYSSPAGNVTCPARPSELTVSFTGEFVDEFPFDCAIPIKQVANNQCTGESSGGTPINTIPIREPYGLTGQFLVLTNFTFETWAYSELAFMDRDTMVALRRENLDPAREYGFSSRVISRYTPGPVALGMMDKTTQPFGVDLQDPDQRMPSFGVTLDNAWLGRGGVTKVHYLTLMVPDIFQIDVSTCSGLKTADADRDPTVTQIGSGSIIGFPVGFVGPPNQGQHVVPNGYVGYKIEGLEFPSTQTYKTIRCEIEKTSSTNQADLVGPDLAPRVFTFLAVASYDYSTETYVPARLGVEVTDI